jgi:hypothetical protein
MTLIRKLAYLVFGDPNNKGLGAANFGAKGITDIECMQKVREVAGIDEGTSTKLFIKWNNTTKRFETCTNAGEGAEDNRINDGSSTQLFPLWNDTSKEYDVKILADFLTALGISQISVNSAVAPTGLKQLCIDSGVMYFSVASGQNFVWTALSLGNHNHSGVYSPVNHNHDTLYAAKVQEMEANLYHDGKPADAPVINVQKNAFNNEVTFGMIYVSPGVYRLAAYIGMVEQVDIFNVSKGTVSVMINDMPGSEFTKATIKYVAETGGGTPQNAKIIVETGAIGFDTDHLTYTGTDGILDYTTIKILLMAAPS